MNSRPKMLVVTTEYPFPARNGITIPVSNYITQLEGEFDITLHVLCEDCADTAKPCLEWGGVTEFIPVSRSGNPFTEIFCGHGVFELEPVEEPQVDKYEVILASPISAIRYAKHVAGLVNKGFNVSPRIVSAISDSYTAVLSSKNDYSSLSEVRNTVVSRIRSLWMRNLEGKILQGSDDVWVQSERDREWLKRSRFFGQIGNVRVVTNGVDSSLFTCSAPTFERPMKFIFVATLTSEYYRSKLLWFYRNVWKKRTESNSSIFFVRGRGLDYSDSRFRALLSDSSVVYDPSFKSSISDVYSDADILVAPVFKSYGFINKVAEAMAAGLVVVGDSSAVNTIDDFEHGYHGFICNSACEFRDVIKKIVNNTFDLKEISANARSLAKRDFHWRDRIRNGCL